MTRGTLVGIAALVVGCGSVVKHRATVQVDAASYRRGQNVRVTIRAKRASIGTYLRIQRREGGRWREVAVYNPKQQCPEMLERPEGGYRFVTKRSAMCRLLEGTWVVIWEQMIRRQCTKPVPVAPGTYRICVAQFQKRCLVREGPYGFERPKGPSEFVCSRPFQVR